MAKNYVNIFRGENYITPSKFCIKGEPETPIEEDFGDHNRLDSSYDIEDGPMRKSLSMSDISTLRDDLLSLGLQNDREQVYQRYMKPTGHPELSKTKFVSVAEAIYHYQRDTPGRFRSSRPQTFQTQNARGPSGLTVPHSPILRCKSRSRRVHIPSQKEKEEMELEEIKKFKIKANPVPKSVIEGSKVPEVTKKPATVPEPFKLTELIHKQLPQSPDKVQFKARPAPKHILEKPHIPMKPPVQITKPVSPKFHYKRSNSVDTLALAANKMSVNALKVVPQRHGPLRLEPFSFEKRDEDMKRRRDERIKQQIEEDRKQASLFKAKPVPGAVKKRMRSVTATGSGSTTSSENKENFTKFEARPPFVLYKEPFKPILKPTQLVKPVPFDLTTEKRAAERERFDKLLKEKEEQQEKTRIEREREQQEAEEENKAQLRAKLVHHAKPVPIGISKPFVPEKSIAPLTLPETPKFVRKLKHY